MYEASRAAVLSLHSRVPSCRSRLIWSAKRYLEESKPCEGVVLISEMIALGIGVSDSFVMECMQRANCRVASRADEDRMTKRSLPGEFFLQLAGIRSVEFDAEGKLHLRHLLEDGLVQLEPALCAKDGSER